MHQCTPSLLMFLCGSFARSSFAACRAFLGTTLSTFLLVNQLIISFQVMKIIFIILIIFPSSKRAVFIITVCILLFIIKILGVFPFLLGGFLILFLIFFGWFLGCPSPLCWRGLFRRLKAVRNKEASCRRCRCWCRSFRTSKVNFIAK